MTDPYEAIKVRDEAQATILEAIKKAHAFGVKITAVNARWSGMLTVDGKDIWPPVLVEVEAQVEIASIPSDVSNQWDGVTKTFRPQNGKPVAELKPKQ